MIESLISCRLFKDIEPSQIAQIMEDSGSQSKHYAQGDVVAIEGGKYSHLMIVVHGVVQAEKSDSFNHPIAVERILAPSIIAPKSLFSDDPVLPVSLSAKSEATVIYIEKSELCLQMSRSITLMSNFMEVLSSENNFVTEKAVYSTYKSIRSKYANYLLDKMELECSNSFTNDLTQREMADLFGVTRPALARTIRELMDEGAIYVKNKDVILLYPEKVKQYARL